MADDEGLCIRAFHLEDAALESLELDLPPTSGLEYLRRVQMEAQQCPDIVVADLDVHSFTKKQTVNVDMSNGCLPAPSGYAADLKWQRHQVAEFSEVRQKLVKYKMACKKKQIKLPSLPVPSAENADSWCRMCFGKKQEQLADKEETGDDKPGSPPLLSLVAGLDQMTIEKVLDHHISWFEKYGFSEEQGRWFYALLCCLEKPLIPEVCSLLRRFVRNCSNVRASLESSEDPLLPALNLFITLVARYFDQMDLVDHT